MLFLWIFGDNVEDSVALPLFEGCGGDASGSDDAWIEIQLPHSPADGGDISDGSNGDSLIPVIAPRVIVVHRAAALFRKHTPLI